ncbi:eukaryotic_translation initiation factor 2B delta subunit [Hexamita inflata]|uniref:Eukaryotic translation initiation factor 2B delta subunit n=1 Tax=Hexamita inflata TaxID=28002 RepID=A0AA86TZX2_9EUKA|nr:eukaryotic translation initiation factor 2B delta subunit [Hexamita inflata]
MNIGNILEMDPFLDNCSSKQVQSKEINVTSCNAFQQDTDQDSQLPLLEDQKLVQGVLLQNQKIKQQSHLHTLLFGFGEPVTDSRVPMATISKTAPPPFKFVVSYELKQWIDLLSDFRQSPSRVFEFFLFAFDAQVKVLGLTLDDLLFCGQNDVKNQPEIDESQVEVSESHQSETISTEKKDESGVEPEVSEPENGIHRSQTQVMMTKQTLDYKIIVAEYINKVHKYLISIVLSFYPQLPAQYENFEEQLNDFHQTVKVQRTMNQQHILQDYQKEFKQFIKSTINKTRQARNQIHRELGLWLTQGSNLLVQLWEVELLFLVYYVSNYILKYFATSNADDKFQQIISSWRLFMNYSLTQEGQKYDFDRIRPQSTIQSRYLIFQKGKIEITTCNKRTAMTKQTRQKMFREGQLIHLTNLGSSEAFVFSSFLGPTDEFIKYCTNLNQLYHLFKMSLCNFYVLVNKTNL